MSLREWLQQSDPDEEPLLSLHVVINKHGMKHVDWAAFTREVIVDEDGNGIIRKQVSAGQLSFYARLLLPLGSDVIITSPPELIEIIRQYAHEILEHYS